MYNKTLIFFYFFRYADNPYHNNIHAFDVTQTANFFLKKCNVIELANLTYLEIAAIYLATSIHDFEHPFFYFLVFLLIYQFNRGTNNAFQIATRSVFGLRYNGSNMSLF